MYFIKKITKSQVNFEIIYIVFHPISRMFLVDEKMENVILRRESEECTTGGEDSHRFHLGWDSKLRFHASEPNAFLIPLIYFIYFIFIMV